MVYIIIHNVSQASLQGMGADYMLVYKVLGAICMVCIALALHVLQLVR